MGNKISQDVHHAAYIERGEDVTVENNHLDGITSDIYVAATSAGVRIGSNYYPVATTITDLADDTVIGQAMTVTGNAGVVMPPNVTRFISFGGQGLSTSQSAAEGLARPQGRAALRAPARRASAGDPVAAERPDHAHQRGAPRSTGADQAEAVRAGLGVHDGAREPERRAARAAHRRRCGLLVPGGDRPLRGDAPGGDHP